MPDKYEWAQAFLEQAKIDLALGMQIYSTLSDRRNYATIVALSQQATEKAIKVVMFTVDDRKFLLHHDPLKMIWDNKSNRTKSELIKHNIISSDNEKKYFCWLLQLAPGASSSGEKCSLDELLKQRNTEYPYESADNTKVELPWRSFTETDIIKAKRTAGMVVSRIEKYLHRLELARPIPRR